MINMPTGKVEEINEIEETDQEETDHDEIEIDSTIDDIKKLEEIKDKISELLNEARQLIRNYPRAYERADAYWLAHMECALDKNSKYLGSSMVTMDDTISEIKNSEIRPPPMILDQSRDSIKNKKAKI